MIQSDAFDRLVNIAPQTSFLPWANSIFSTMERKIRIDIWKIYFQKNHRSDHKNTFSKLLKHLKEY